MKPSTKCAYNHVNFPSNFPITFLVFIFRQMGITFAICRGDSQFDMPFLNVNMTFKWKHPFPHLCKRHTFFWCLSIKGVFVNKMMLVCMKSIQMRSFFWSVFSCIQTEYGEIQSIAPYFHIWTLFMHKNFKLLLNLSKFQENINWDQHFKISFYQSCKCNKSL